MDDVYFNPYVYYQYDSSGNIVSALYGIVDNVNETIWGATTHYEYDKNRLSKVQIDGEDTRNTADSVNVSYEYYDELYDILEKYNIHLNSQAGIEIDIKDDLDVLEAYNYSTERIYQSSDEIGEYIIDGEKLKDFFDNVEITFRCF